MWAYPTNVLDADRWATWLKTVLDTLNIRKGHPSQSNNIPISNSFEILEQVEDEAISYSGMEEDAKNGDRKVEEGKHTQEVRDKDALQVPPGKVGSSHDTQQLNNNDPSREERTHGPYVQNQLMEIRNMEPTTQSVARDGSPTQSEPISNV